MPSTYTVVATDSESQASSVTLEYSTIEDALFQAFLMLDAGQTVSSVSGPDIELTREQIKRKWRAARQ